MDENNELRPPIVVPLENMCTDLRYMQQEIDRFILATPTGDRRNKLTVVSLLLLELVGDMKKQQLIRRG